MSTTVPTNFIFLRKDIISFYFKKMLLVWLCSEFAISGLKINTYF